MCIRDSHNGYYVKKLEEGLEFQDVATTALYQRGIVVVAYSSRRWQDERGENMLGAEIKRDGKFRQTGNLYIETAEKSHPDNPVYVPVSYTHLRAHETVLDIVCRLLLEKKKNNNINMIQFTHYKRNNI